MYEDILKAHKFITSYEKLLRMMVYVERFIDICSTSTNLSASITVEEITDALLTYCGIVPRSITVCR